MLEYAFYFATVLCALAVCLGIAVLVSMWRHHRMINRMCDTTMFEDE